MMNNHEWEKQKKKRQRKEKENSLRKFGEKCRYKSEMIAVFHFILFTILLVKRDIKLSIIKLLYY